MKSKLLIFICLMFMITSGCTTVQSLVSQQNQKEVLFYTTYGFQQGDEWVIPMRVFVHRQRNRTKGVAASFAARRYGLNDYEKELFKTRADDFVADGEWREVVEFVFAKDPENRAYRIKNKNGKVLRTDFDGLKEGYIRIPVSRADSLLHYQQTTDNWLDIQAVSNLHDGNGKIQLLEPEGVSVISDIDDTIKVTELPAGSDVVIRNTFFKDFEAAPGMYSLYDIWKENNAAFHYVSGAPWQLYDPITSFLFDVERESLYPKGSFHMKTVRKSFFNPGTWADFGKLLFGKNVTKNQKTGQITTLLERFPERRFILVGDSGEKDPEIYSAMRERYPEQVKKIIIRDVVNAREHEPDRLTGMEIIPARTIYSGVSQK
ncbi:DUF2183 domain-containing protein [Rhodohalobacter sp. SW132]|uniref:phosphatidate phosphatase App1 family protein n=1 Tax=Rhodohalobacter sp. SW132 TaxID=2293433 RepID=UPI000E22210C|nr:App1 family protein [Rhodohalobacter sp. SW132]REL33130.1 DUF2183 domain-containing protein [Rhodohalobacter sp. SW132]